LVSEQAIMTRSKERAHPRVPANITATVRTGGKAAIKAGRIRNISLGGVFVEIPEPLPFGTDVDIEFSLPSGAGVLRCKGFVVWSTKDDPDKADGKQGIGVRLTDIGVQEMRDLAEFIESQRS
jgi:uncharacterized protein (TIGR02266 family)